MTKWLKWQDGRQGTGYAKMLLAQASRPFAFDCYILRYPVGTSIPPHRDYVAGRKHYRLNIVVKQSEGGEFLCENPIFSNGRINFFRPDESEHSVTTVTGSTRYVFSIGWLCGKSKPSEG